MKALTNVWTLNAIIAAAMAAYLVLYMDMSLYSLQLVWQKL